MTPSPVHDHTAHRRESATRSREMRPLLTREPLSHDREKKPPARPPKRRKPAAPTTPVLTFDPKHSGIPSGKQDPVPAHVLHKSTASESSAGSYDEQQMTPSYEYEAQKWSRGCPEQSAAEHSVLSPDTSYTDGNDICSVPSDSYDSPESHTSSSSPAPSDQSPCTTEFAIQGVDYPRQGQASVSMCPFDNQTYGHPPVVHQGSYGYTIDPCQDRPAQGYHPVHYFDPAYGRPGAHGGPAYPGNNGYYTSSRRY